MIEYAVRTRLLAVAGVTALVGNRVYMAELPQRAKFPAITCQVISDVPEYDMEGEAGVNEVRVQVTCWALERRGVDAYDVARNVADAVQTALSGFTGTVGSDTFQSCFMSGRRAIHDDKTATWSQIIDWAIGHS